MMNWISDLRGDLDHAERLETDLTYFAEQYLKIRPKAGSLRVRFKRVQAGDHNAFVNDTGLLFATTGNAGGNRAWVHLPVHSHYAKLEEVGPAGMVIAPDANCPIHGSAAQLEEHD
jgi:hypothetical protein